MSIDKVSLARVFIERFEKEIGKIVLFSAEDYKKPLAEQLSKLPLTVLYDLNTALSRKHRRKLERVKNGKR